MENVPSTELQEKQLPEKQKEKPQLDFQAQIEALIPTAGTIELSDEQKTVLYAPVKDEDVEIRPDGLVYLPWMEYVSRLKDAFGLSWAIIPKGMPSAKDNFILWPFYFVIQGKLAGFAVGEQQYIPSNATMTYGDALEGAKSNALMRLCKGIGISLELWKPSFVRIWKEKHAEKYQTKNKRGETVTLWKKKGNGHTPEGTGQTESTPPSNLISDPQRKRFYAISKKTGASDDQIKEWLFAEYGFSSTSEITRDVYDEVCQKVEHVRESGQEG